MTPSQQLFKLVGSRRRYLKDVTNLKEHLPNVKKIRILFQLEGIFLACAKASLSCVGTACDSPCRTVIRVDHQHSSHTVRAVCFVTVVLYVGIIPIRYPYRVYGARLHIFSSIIVPQLTSRTAPSRVEPTLKIINKMETNLLEP